MSQTCKDRFVGQIICSSISINGMPRKLEDQQAIQNCLPKEMQKAQKLQEQYQADLKTGKVAPPTPDEAKKYQEVEQAMADPAKRADAIDHRVMCSVACCCNKNADKSSSDGDLMQICTEQVFKAADKAMNYKSRYKPEVWWDMAKETDGIPKAFMHRDKDGSNTLKPSDHGMHRTGEIDGFISGQGYLRRTDVVIVSDSEKPPGEGNIDKVVEMKYRKDARDDKQDKAYVQIAGDKENYQVYRIGSKSQTEDERQCNCDHPMLPVE